MGARKGAALRFLQWFVRGVQFTCAALILAIFSYILATLHNHGLEIATWIRTVEGIAGFATLYTLCALVLLCFLAGRTLTSFLAIVFDVAFIASFIYIASANRAGAGSCTGQVDTAFGSGDADTRVVDDGHGGFTTLPSLRQACQLESACLGIAIVAIFFFVFSIALEVQLGRHHQREKRFGAGPQNDPTPGYGKKSGLFGWMRRQKTVDTENFLPEHTHPDQLPDRTSFATSHTAVDHTTDIPYHKYADSSYGGYENPHELNRLQSQPPAGYSYGDGVYERT